MQSSTVLDSISKHPYNAGELFVGFLTNQANTPLHGGGRATRMPPDATTEKIRDKNKSRFDSSHAVRSNPYIANSHAIRPHRAGRTNFLLVNYKLLHDVLYWS